MTQDTFINYRNLVRFLGEMLGPQYEVVLQDTDPEVNGIVAIANGALSGRTVGSPLTGTAIKFITERRYETSDSVMNYTGMLEDGRKVRSSTMFIKENGKLVGMLCINFDGTEFSEMARSLLSLVHPEDYIDRNFRIFSKDTPKDGQLGPEALEVFRTDTKELMNDIFAETVEKIGVPVDRLTQDEKINLISRLKEHGFFNMKGAVAFVSKRIGSSQASVYRYLGKV
ncbi:MAG: PAS domain-containing protein [Eubacteriales bacterium]|nr:PAS domain-containing protein [Eubacteriales bacterium]